jgi:hypothetical protein
VLDVADKQDAIEPASVVQVAKRSSMVDVDDAHD